MSAVAALVRERTVALDAVRRAMLVCSRVQHQLAASDTKVKQDASPVTVADYAAQAVINTVLADAFPQVRIVGEEDTAGLRRSEDQAAAHLRERITTLANSVLDRPRTSDEVNLNLLDAIDRGSYQGGREGQHWTLDPVDGTKGFLRGGQYAVCLALIENGAVRLGVLGCPNLPTSAGHFDPARDVMFVAVRGEGAYQRTADDPTEHRVQLRSLPKTNGKIDFAAARLCESWEAGHSNQGLNARIASALGLRGQPARLDSQCKYGVVARGEADLYLRLPVRADYVEKIWDHAAGALLVEEAGARVTDADGQPLDFGRGRLLSGNRGIVVAHHEAHEQVLEAVQQALNAADTSPSTAHV
ncbi:hypothetical protein THASP1DRAFT_34674 [Thamnocephalis sphaerospora]|uniref:3'(2'),5'-bisphosphate nucleotidase n=1 Tax=Thamnocephalis sphaerospora TaxID=78915 RepID=A0A4P9XR92_9FUNG|nr:hypothetical protein THASP1DRAFT_34674 [Thamnocephalis sphaerospora]|eukprot:RKP08442.1 hypothetical protein THASP1DRAFT_34674 [Thamnocephalis sphaerospora]